MNHVSLIGRLTRDPEIRYSGDLAIARFSLAIDRPPKRDGTKETDFPNIVVFGRQAENCEKYLHKGRMAAVEGRISYTNRDGVKVYTTEVVAQRVEFIDWGDRGGSRQQRGWDDGAQSGGYGNARQGGGYEKAPQSGGYDNAPQGGGYDNDPQQDTYRQDSRPAEQSADRGDAPNGAGSAPSGFEAIDDDDIPF